MWRLKIYILVREAIILTNNTQIFGKQIFTNVPIKETIDFMCDEANDHEILPPPPSNEILILRNPRKFSPVSTVRKNLSEIFNLSSLKIHPKKIISTNVLPHMYPYQNICNTMYLLCVSYLFVHFLNSYTRSNLFYDQDPTYLISKPNREGYLYSSFVQVKRLISEGDQRCSGCV